MQRVIITGATGSIGIALINELIYKEIEILVFCREGSDRNNHIPKHPLIEKKYCSLNQLANIKNDTGKSYDIFYHFAWEGTTGVSRNNMYLQNMNIKYALDAVGAAHRFGCHTFIGAGSQAEYGRVNGKISPDTPVFPETGYGIGKLCAGLMTKEFAHQLGIKQIWVRILSVYGPYDQAQSMIMSTINKLKAGITPQFTPGGQIWDYLYSRDAANAFYLIGKNGVDGKTYVLGSGNAKPIVEYINEIKTIVNKNAKIDLGVLPYSERQVMYLCADISELKKDVGFKPDTSFITGIEYTLDWSNRI